MTHCSLIWYDAFNTCDLKFIIKLIWNLKGLFFAMNKSAIFSKSCVMTDASISWLCIALGCFCSLTCFVEAHVFFWVNMVFFCVQNTNMCVVKMMTFATCNIDFWLFCNLWYWHFLKNYCIIFVKILVLVLIRFVWHRSTKNVQWRKWDKW